MRQAINAEQQIIDLLSQLELAGSAPFMVSPTRGDTHPPSSTGDSLGHYRRGDDCDDHRLREGARRAESAEHRAHVRRNHIGTQKLDTGMVE